MYIPNVIRYIFDSRDTRRRLAGGVSSFVLSCMHACHMAAVALSRGGPSQLRSRGTEVGACLLIVARREQISGVAPAAGLTVLCVRASGLRALYGSDAYSNAVQLLCPGLNT
jgi:hypothetical protein